MSWRIFPHPVLLGQAGSPAPQWGPHYGSGQPEHHAFGCNRHSESRAGRFAGRQRRFAFYLHRGQAIGPKAGNRKVFRELCYRAKSLVPSEQPLFPGKPYSITEQRPLGPDPQAAMGPLCRDPARSRCSRWRPGPHRFGKRSPLSSPRDVGQDPESVHHSKQCVWYLVDGRLL